MDIRSFDLFSSSLKLGPDAGEAGQGRLHELRVPGLAENRPPVVVGDVLYLRAEGAEQEWEVRRRTEGFPILGP